jgi:hypothetical protein
MNPSTDWKAVAEGPDMRVVEHLERPGKVCEIWFNGRLMGTMTIFDIAPVVAVYSKHLEPEQPIKRLALAEGVTAVLVLLGG